MTTIQESNATGAPETAPVETPIKPKRRSPTKKNPIESAPEAQANPVIPVTMETQDSKPSEKSKEEKEAERLKNIEQSTKKWGESWSTSESGSVRLATMDEQIKYAALLLQNKMISTTFTTPQEVVIGIQYSKAMNLDPIVGLRMMYVIEGRPTLWGDGPLSLAWRSRQLVSLEEFFIDANGERIQADKKNLKSEVFGSVTRSFRKGDLLVQEDFFTEDDIIKAKLDMNKWGKKDTYEKYRRTMMRYKGRAMNLKSKFTDIINGIPIAEYDFHFSPDIPEIPPTAHGRPNSVAGQANDFNSYLEATNEAKRTELAINPPDAAPNPK